MLLLLSLLVECSILEEQFSVVFRTETFCRTVCFAWRLFDNYCRFSFDFCCTTVVLFGLKNLGYRRFEMYISIYLSPGYSKKEVSHITSLDERASWCEMFMLAPWLSRLGKWTCEISTVSCVCPRTGKESDFEGNVYCRCILIYKHLSKQYTTPTTSQSSPTSVNIQAHIRGSAWGMGKGGTILFYAS